MCDWTSCIGAKDKPPAQLHIPIPSMSTSKGEPHPPTNKWFKFTNEDTLKEFSKGLIPVNTVRSTKWALNVWHEQINKSSHLSSIHI